MDIKVTRTRRIGYYEITYDDIRGEVEAPRFKTDQWWGIHRGVVDFREFVKKKNSETDDLLGEGFEIHDVSIGETEAETIWNNNHNDETWTLTYEVLNE